MTRVDLHHVPAVVHVVVPCHDEELLLPRCLAGLDRAARALTDARPGVRVRTTVVLDRCTDDSAAVVAAHTVAAHAAGRDLTAVAVSAGSVGAARRLGVEHAVGADDGHGAGRVWLASTDADSLVPPHWLVTQVDLAQQGIEMVVGTVLPDPADVEPKRLAVWHSRHRPGPGHPHVHGANLGITLEAYLAVGGFAPVAVGEDAALAEAVRRSGRRWCATGAAPVLTSGRLAARVRHGFAGYLRDLDPAVRPLEVPAGPQLA